MDAFYSMQKVKVKSLSRVWLCDPLDCSLPGSSVHGISQARILKWVAISFSRRSSQPRDWTQISHIVGRRFTVWATREVLIVCKVHLNKVDFWLLKLITMLSWRWHEKHTDKKENNLPLNENLDNIHKHRLGGKTAASLSRIQLNKSRCTLVTLQL